MGSCWLRRSLFQTQECGAGSHRTFLRRARMMYRVRAAPTLGRHCLAAFPSRVGPDHDPENIHMISSGSFGWVGIYGRVYGFSSQRKMPVLFPLSCRSGWTRGDLGGKHSKDGSCSQLARSQGRNAAPCTILWDYTINSNACEGNNLQFFAPASGLDKLGPRIADLLSDISRVSQVCSRSWHHEKARTFHGKARPAKGLWHASICCMHGN